MSSSGQPHPVYPHVFSPLQVGPVELPNRFYFSPHGTPLAVGSQPSNDFAYYAAARVAGGCGMVNHSLPLMPRIGAKASAYQEASIPSFEAVAETVHDLGGKMFGQLHYWWCNPGPWEPLSPQAPSLGPSSGQRFENFSGVHAMSKAEIRAMADAHRRCSDNLRRAGYDGIQVHAAHGIIAEQFLSPYFNQRTDEYGGSPENRRRFLTEMLEAAREGAGADMAVGIRFNCDEMLPGGYTQEDAIEILGHFASSGLIDFADLDVAIEPNQFPLGMPPVFVAPHLYRSFVSEVRKAAGDVPVFSVLGRMTSVEDAEGAIAAGVCDAIGAARGLIAEPDLVKNAREGEEERSRTCIACNQCMEAFPSWGGAFCAINPGSYREGRWGVDSFTPATERKKVVIVGGGPGGMEAARTAALMNHEVVLLEKTSSLGGGLAGWAKLPDRGDFMAGVDWYEREVRRLGVDVRTGVEANSELVLSEQPGAVIIATGASYSAEGRSGFMAGAIPGWERDFVYTPEQILDQGARPTGKVLILDDEGINTGAGVAEVLAGNGANVEMYTRWLMPVTQSLVWSIEFAFIIPRLKNLGVKFNTETYFQSIGDHEVRVFDVFTNVERTITDVDAIVLATMRTPQDEIARELEGRVDQLFTIGDALAPRPLSASTYEGRRFARMIGDPDAPKDFAEAYWQMPTAETLPKPASEMLATAST